MRSLKSEANSIESITQPNNEDTKDEGEHRLKSKKSKSKRKGNSKKSKTDLSDSESKTDSDDGSTHSDSETIAQFNDDDPKNWWKQPDVIYAFNLPIVRTNLERLTGTDVMKLSDHQFMMDLRTNNWNDFDEKLTNKIKQREIKEIERTKQLILKCKFNRNNCPKKLVPLHSDVLALDLHNEPIGSFKPNRSNQFNGPVFNVNHKTNSTIHLRRKKIKTIRKTNFEYLMRHVLNEIASSEKLEYDNTREIQEHINSIHAKKRKNFEFVSRMVMKMKSMFKSKNVRD